MSICIFIFRICSIVYNILLHIHAFLVTCMHIYIQYCIYVYIMCIYTYIERKRESGPELVQMSGTAYIQFDKLFSMNLLPSVTNQPSNAGLLSVIPMKLWCEGLQGCPRPPAKHVIRSFRRAPKWLCSRSHCRLNLYAI